VARRSDTARIVARATQALPAQPAPRADCDKVVGLVWFHYADPARDACAHFGVEKARPNLDDEVVIA
jgi:hypothetical protein